MWWVMLAAAVVMYLMAIWIKSTTTNISPLSMMIFMALFGGAIVCSGVGTVGLLGDALGATLDRSLPMLVYRGLHVLFGVAVGIYGAWLYGMFRSR